MLKRWFINERAECMFLPFQGEHFGRYKILPRWGDTTCLWAGHYKTTNPHSALKELQALCLGQATKERHPEKNASGRHALKGTSKLKRLIAQNISLIIFHAIQI